jgi:hypothetical protein
MISPIGIFFYKYSNMKFDELVNLLLEKNLGSRVTTGTSEVQDILKTNKLKSRVHGDVFFANSSEPDKTYLPKNIDQYPKGAKMGYVLRADADKLENPSMQAFKKMFGRMPEKGKPSQYPHLPSDDEWMDKWGKEFDKQNYKVLPADSPSSNVKTIQRISKDPQTGDYKFGKERNFERFQKIYNGLSKASKEGKINISANSGKIEVKPANVSMKLPNLLSRIGVGVGSLAGLNQFLNNELPADMKNNLIKNQGGYGIDKKFVAEP